jgi:hypothetical protein
MNKASTRAVHVAALGKVNQHYLTADIQISVPLSADSEATRMPECQFNVT